MPGKGSGKGSGKGKGSIIMEKVEKLNNATWTFTHSLLAQPA